MNNQKPSPFRRPLSHSLYPFRPKRFNFYAFLARHLQSFTAIFTLISGTASFVLAVVVANSEQRIENMQTVIDALRIRGQRQEVLIQELRTIAVNDRVMIRAIDSLNRISLGSLQTMRQQAHLIDINAKASIQPDSINFIELSNRNWTKTRFRVSNKGQRVAYEVKLLVNVFDSTGVMKSLIDSATSNFPRLQGSGFSSLDIYWEKPVYFFNRKVIQCRISFKDETSNKSQYFVWNYYSIFLNGRIEYFEFTSVAELEYYKKVL